MSRQIVGTVIYNETPDMCTINVIDFFGKKNIKMEIIDNNNSAKINDIIIAREMLLPVKGKQWRLTQITQRKK